MLIRLQDRAEVARQAHNLEVVGSIPTPATNGPIVVEVAPKTASGLT